MRSSELRKARDYNRGLLAPIRWAHVAGAAVAPPARLAWNWAGKEPRRRWARPVLVAVLGFALILPFDRLLSRFAAWLMSGVGGDIRRQLEWFHEYGQFGAIVIAAWVIWQLDAERRHRLVTWGIGLLAAAVVVYPMKLLIGRPRPLYDDPWTFLGPFGQYPVNSEAGVRHAWEIWGGISSRLHSIPSSHTAYAVVMTVFLSWSYPRLRSMAIVLACVVGAGRVLFGAHYVTDVVVGAAIGLAAGRYAIARAERKVILPVATGTTQPETAVQSG